MNADRIAAKYEVSRAWVYRLLQRRRDTGSLAPRAQTKFRRRTLTPAQEDRLVALIAIALFAPQECVNFVHHCGYRVSTAL